MSHNPLDDFRDLVSELEGGIEEIKAELEKNFPRRSAWTIVDTAGRFILVDAMVHLVHAKSVLINLEEGRR